MAKLAGYDQLEIRAKYFEGEAQDAFQMLNDNNFPIFVNALPADEICVIKTHGAFCSAIASSLKDGDASALATYRDPLDVAVSLLDTGKLERSRPKAEQRAWFANIHTLTDTLKTIDWSVSEADKWLSNDSVMNISYRSLFETPLVVATDLQAHFGLGDHAEEVCDRLLSDKTRILEYNVGGIDRWKDRLSDSEASFLKDRYDSFRSKWL
jgi:hypothetical protein